MQRSVTIVLAAAMAASALVACSGGKQSSSTATSTAAASPVASPAAKASPATKATSAAKVAMSNAGAGTAAMGEKVYTANCSSCHQANGKGMPNIFPPLAGNPMVNGDPANVIHTVKVGLNGKITVNGASYAGTMPAWKGTLSDAEIASVITYIRSSWGNKASAVTTAQVTSTP